MDIADLEAMDAEERRVPEDDAAADLLVYLMELDENKTAERDLRRHEAGLAREARWMELIQRPDWETLFDETVQAFMDIYKAHFPVSCTRTFNSKIGVRVEVLATMWLRYGPEFVDAGVTPDGVLQLMSCLTTNDTYDSLAGDWDKTRTPFMVTVKTTLATLYELLDEVSWRPKVWHPGETLAPPDSLFYRATFCLDGTECGIAKPSNKQEEELWYSDKAGQWTVKYETCTHISSGRIMWVAGGIPGSIHDIKLAQNSGVIDAVPEGEWGICDKGYVGMPAAKFKAMLKTTNILQGDVQSRTLALDEKIYNRCLSAVRIEIERVNGRLKRFKALWRSRTRERFEHCIMFSVLCNIVNIQMELEPMRALPHPILSDCPIVHPLRALQ